MPIRNRPMYTLWRNNTTQIAETTDPVDAIVYAWEDWYKHAVRHSQHPAGWHPHPDGITYYVKIGSEVLYEVPSADVTVFNLDGGEPGGSDVIVPIAGAEGRGQASAVTGPQQSVNADVDIAGASATAGAGNVADTIKRWNPHHGWRLQGDGSDPDQDGYWASMESQLLTGPVQDSDNLKGVLVALAWGAVETSPGQFDWTRTDRIMDLAEGQGLQVTWLFMHKNFRANAGVLAPPDLQDQILSVVNSRGREVSTVALWRNGGGGFPDVMGRYITAVKAVFDRYDSNPYFEMLIISEIVPSFGGVPGPDDYSRAGLATQHKRLYAEIGAQGYTANFAGGVNQLADEVVDLIESQYQNNCGHSTPDLRSTPGHQTFQGEVNDNGNAAVRDYRGEIPKQSTISVQDWVKGPSPQGNFGLLGVDYLIANIIPERGCTHLFWATPTASDIAAGTAPSVNEIVSAIDANPNTITTTCPARYTALGGCSSAV